MENVLKLWMKLEYVFNLENLATVIQPPTL